MDGPKEPFKPIKQIWTDEDDDAVHARWKPLTRGRLYASFFNGRGFARTVYEEYFIQSVEKLPENIIEGMYHKPYKPYKSLPFPPGTEAFVDEGQACVWCNIPSPYLPGQQYVIFVDRWPAGSHAKRRTTWEDLEFDDQIDGLLPLAYEPPKAVFPYNRNDTDSPIVQLVLNKEKMFPCDDYKDVKQYWYKCALCEEPGQESGLQEWYDCPRIGSEEEYEFCWGSSR